jgi:microcystin-dependent protein
MADIEDRQFIPSGELGDSSGVDSVNGQTGVVVLDTDDISDSAASNKYVTTAEKTKLANLSGTNTGDQTSVTGNAGTATALQTARNIDGVSFNGTADITVVAPATHAASSKATPVDADEIPLVDSAASNVLKKLTWANLKATLKTYLDSLATTFTNKTMSGTSNTFTNLPNSALTNPSLTIGSTTVALGATAATLAGLTLTTPTIASFVNAGHDHSNAAGGGQITDAALSAPVTVAKGGSGRATATTAYGIIAAGTTATGAQQTIATGTSGQFLKSAGAAALATFVTINSDDIADGTTYKQYSATDKTKLAGIEALADVTDAGNVDAAGATMNSDTTLAGNGYFLDEDAMTSDSATKVPSQQSVKAFVIASIAASGGGDVSSNTATSVDSELALFSSTSGKLIKRGTTTGILKGTSGVVSAATAETDYVTPTGAGTLQNKIVDSTSPTAFNPAGIMQPYGGRTAPTGWLLCDGSAVSRTTYSGLFDVLCNSLGTFTVTIAAPAVVSLTAHGLVTGDQVYLTTTGALPTGLSANTLYYIVRIDANSFNLSTSRANALAGTKITTTGSQSGVHTARWCPYGLGDGSTTFTLPDLRGRIAAGADAMGGTAASRLSLAQTQGVYGNAGANGGEQGHTLTNAEIPETAYKVGTALGGANFDTFAVGTTAVAATQDMGTTAGGGGHNTVQPTLVTNYIIKT